MTSARERSAASPGGTADERHAQPTAPREWTIAEIAEEFGVTHRTLRHYETVGIIAPQRRGTNRVFRRRDRVRLALALRGKRLGFPLEEIRRIVDMYDDHPGEVGQLRYLLDQIGDRRADLEQRRRDIDELLAELDEVEARCRADLRGFRAESAQSTGAAS